MDNQTYMMVVTPHPDDAEFGVAGTVLRMTREGKKVVYPVFLSMNNQSSQVKKVL